jgi:small GTP-binding protein
MSSKTKSYKLVLLGDTAVGKSCIAVRFVRDEYNEFQEPTIGAAFLTSKINYNNKNYKFEIWDTAGQERYRSLAPMYYRGSSAAIIVYDITHKDSFYGAKTWINEIKKKASHSKIILVGNKNDLKNDRDIDNSEVDNFVSANFIEHLLVSAKTGENINKIFEIICSILPDKVEIQEELVNNIVIREKSIKSNCC